MVVRRGDPAVEAEARPVNQRGWRLLAKRAVDVAIAGTALVATAPVMAGAAGAVWMSMGRPVFFRQERLGRGERVFRIVKLRTMRPAHPEATPDQDAARLTSVGRFLRATSLDELPQLLNVLKGDMSLVGPRPLLVRYLPRYSARQRRRHEVLPGLTGWAQVNGRNTVEWAEKLERDVWYVDHWSVALDLKILAKTAVLVLRRDGVSAEGHATMPEFEGEVSR